MKKSDNQNIPPLSPDQSRLVVMRSSLHGIGVPAVMYQIVDEKPVFFGVLHNNEKIYIDTTPGQHTFMSHSVSVRFLRANMLPGKTYYAMAAPRGWPAVNFNLHPFTRAGTGEFALGGDQFKSWLSDTALMLNTPEANEWSKGRSEVVNMRFDKEWPIWKNRPEDFKNRYTLTPEDGE